jgi:chorismate mutase/prephenate dehydratase
MTDGPRERAGDHRSEERGDLKSLRAQIDELDVQIVGLLNRRARLGLEAGRAKALSGRVPADSDREREVLVRVAMANNGPMPQDALLALYRQLIETIRRLEELEVAGPEGDSHG